ncbi:hypothetical protein VKT23_008951 [Stygiomarasmius scandens]|uniref:Uncharacterized protein n=1 Tax=Marasmiellus scandens TaxID=2682957 RepID=A0ABR1JK87_9AGAR
MAVMVQLRFPAQRYFFSHTRLDNTDTCNKMNRVLQSSESPHLATHVDTVTVQVL